MQVKAIKSKTGIYREIIEVNAPIRFFWDKDGFDGIEFSLSGEELMPWEEEMLIDCLEAIIPAIHCNKEVVE